MTPDQLSVVVRTVSLVALYQAVGATFFLALFDASLSRSRLGIRRLGILSAFAGLVLVLAHQTLDAARLADDFNALTDGAMLQLAWQSSSGTAHAAQALGLAGVGVGLIVAQRAGSLLATTGACVAALALLLTGHSSIHPLRWLLAPLLAVHLLVVGFWFGALAPLYWSVTRESPSVAARLVVRFSTVAGWLVPCILVAGMAVAYVLSPDLAILERTYGKLVLVKVAAFVLLMALASYNKWWLTPAMESGRPGAARSLRQIVSLEFLLIVGVLAVTATLTTYYSPEA